MKWAFVLFTLYSGPIGAFLYVLGCREPLPGLHEQYVAARWRQALGSTMHCVAGDGVGILVGAVIGAMVALPMAADMVLEYVLGFAFGWTIFQALFMRDMFGSYARSLKGTFTAELLSMNCLMGGMMPVAAIAFAATPGAHDPSQPLFWFRLSLALMFGALVAYPINWWLCPSSEAWHDDGSAKRRAGCSVWNENGQGERVGAPFALLAGLGHGRDLFCRARHWSGNRAEIWRRALAPKASARARDHGDKPEHEIDLDDAARLIESRSSILECLRLDRPRKAAPRREVEVEEEQHHYDAGELHHVDVQRCGLKAAEAKEQHRIATHEQHHDACPNPGEEAAQDAVPERKPSGRFERSGRRAQNHIGEKHAAHPNHGGYYMQRNQEGHSHAAILYQSGIRQSSTARRASLLREATAHKRRKLPSPTQAT
jgi:hypothetical protein